MVDKDVKVLILRTAGTNCDEETAFAFSTFGADVTRKHINVFLKDKESLNDYHILAIPGGFTYGDDVESGKILANEILVKLGGQIADFLKQEKLVIGICNGFQVLVKAGILPGPFEAADVPAVDRVTLTHNDSGKFEDRWTYLRADGRGPWLDGIGGTVYFPVAHAEGKFVVHEKNVLKELNDNQQVAFRYVSNDGKSAGYPANPNGSLEDIAGITDATGRVLGLMPHPERHLLKIHHPSWHRMKNGGTYGDGAKIFENGVKYVKKNLVRQRAASNSFK